MNNKYKITPDWKIIEDIYIIYPTFRQDLIIFFFNFIKLLSELSYNNFKRYNLNIIVNNNNEKRLIKKNLKNILGLNLKTLLIPNDDIWIRDFFPLNLKDNNQKTLFLKSNYSPSYSICEEKLNNNAGYEFLFNKRNKEITKINKEFIPLNWDFGNITSNGKYNIISEKIFKENNKLSPKNIVDILNSKLNGENIFIPIEELDIIGHVDGICRFLDEETILLPQFPQEFKMENNYVNQVYKLLQERLPSKYKFIFIPNTASSDVNTEGIYSSYGNYLNFFRLENNIIFPHYSNDEENRKEILRIFKKSFPQLNIYFINCDDLSYWGGVLNCITWVLYK